MLTFVQTTGAVLLGDKQLGQYPLCYSGHGAGLDNPAMESARGIGVIPAGRWHIEAWHDQHHLGRVVAHLTPAGHDAHGRSAFFWHGDNPAMNHTASDGCIISPYDVRCAVRDSGETDLLVVASLPAKA